MEYDPIKDKIGGLVGDSSWRRRLFYSLLDLFFLRAWYVHRTLKQLIPGLAKTSEGQGVQVLDAGSGFGQYSYYMARKFPTVEITGIDVKEDYLASSQKFFKQEGLEHRAQWAVADLTKAGRYPFDRENVFDLILSVDVMEHIKEDRAALQNMARVLRPGGYLLINTPSDQGGSGVTEEGQESFIGEHAREGYKLQNLEEKIRTAGLHPVKSMYAYGPFGSLAWRLLIQGPMKLLAVSWWMILLLPLYYLFILPVGLLLNAADLARTNKTGTGLTVVAQKPVS